LGRSGGANHFATNYFPNPSNPIGGEHDLAGLAFAAMPEADIR
jgi:hypothetical protein